MFRTILFAGLSALAACSAPPQPANQRDAAAPLPTPAAPTADALAAKRVVERYFDLMRARDYAQAWTLWSEGPAPAAGGRKAFIAASKAKGRFDGRAGDPSVVRDDTGTRYILVEASARVTAPVGKVTEQAGVVMLKRPVADGAPWRIWGIDIRPRHCRNGQVARGLGCVSV